MNNAKEIFEKTESFNSIIIELYLAKYNKEYLDPGEMADTIYKSFVKELKRRLEDVFDALNIDINQFKNDKERFVIPVVIGEVFRAFLKRDSKKGSHISRLKSRQYDSITYDETVSLINDVISQLRSRFKRENATEELMSQIDVVEKEWLGEAAYIKQVKEKRTHLIDETSKKINEYVDLICGTDKYADIVSVSLNYQLANLDSSEIPIPDDLDKEMLLNADINAIESFKLLQVYGECLMAGIETWQKVAHKYVIAKNAEIEQCHDVAPSTIDDKINIARKDCNDELLVILTRNTDAYQEQERRALLAAKEVLTSHKK